MTTLHTDTLSVERVLNHVRTVMPSDAVLRVFWLTHGGDKHQVVKDFMDNRGSLCLVPIKLVGVSFLHSDCIGPDLLKVIDSNQQNILEVAEQAPDGPIILVLISRRSFAFSEAVSPIDLPDWFPRVGGKIFPVRIEPLSERTTTSANCDELEVKELARALFELEGALLSRMATRFSEDGPSLIPLGQRIGVAVDPPGLARFLDRAHAAHRNVSDPEAYRPTSIDADALAFKLAKACMNSGLTQWQSLANALATALEVDNEVNWKAAHPTLALIQRIKLEAEAREQFGAGILTTVYCAYQLLTVFHHAHVFGRFPVLTLQYISMDLRAALLRQARMLESLQLTILEKKAN